MTTYVRSYTLPYLCIWARFWQAVIPRSICIIFWARHGNRLIFHLLLLLQTSFESFQSMTRWPFLYTVKTTLEVVKADFNENTKVYPTSHTTNYLPLYYRSIYIPLQIHSQVVYCNCKEWCLQETWTDRWAGWFLYTHPKMLFVGLYKYLITHNWDKLMFKSAKAGDISTLVW